MPEFPVLQAKDVVVERPLAPALTLPDLTISKGEKILLLGPSGSGKTSLLSVIAGFLRPARGTVQVGDMSFYDLDTAARDRLRARQFGFVFQTLHLLPSLTIRQNIALAANMAKEPLDTARLNALLQTFGLTQKADRKPEALSQGEQQRAAIARAVLLKPSLILADEPTSALDNTNAATVIDVLMAQAKDSGAALLVATHDERIMDRFDRVIRLDNNSERAAA